MVRRPEDAARFDDRARAVVADLRDPDAVASALDGVDAAFLNSPSAPDAAEVQTGFIDVAGRVGLPRLVLMSQYAARTDSPVRFLRWHAAVEEHVRAAGIPATPCGPTCSSRACWPSPARSPRAGGSVLRSATLR